MANAADKSILPELPPTPQAKPEARGGSRLKT